MAFNYDTAEKKASYTLSGKEVSCTCPNHGPFTGTERQIGEKTIRPVCPKCEEEREKAERGAERQAHHKGFQNAVRESGIPRIFWGKGFKSFTSHNEMASAVLSEMQQYVSSFGMGISNDECYLMPVIEPMQSVLFIGNSGTGKTHLACAVAQELMYAGKGKAQYMTAYDVALSVKESWGKGASQSERDVYRSLCEPDLLIIDEIGVQHGSNAEILLFFNVFNKRLYDGKPTMLVSNLSAEDLKATVTDRVYDRIRDGKAYMFGWESLRGRKR